MILASVVGFVLAAGLMFAQTGGTERMVKKTIFITKAVRRVTPDQRLKEAWLLSAEDDSASYERDCLLYKNGRSFPAIRKDIQKDFEKAPEKGVPPVKDFSCGPFEVEKRYDATFDQKENQMIIFGLDSDGYVARMVPFLVSRTESKKSGP
jgi:hypothetical protein